MSDTNHYLAFHSFLQATEPNQTNDSEHLQETEPPTDDDQHFCVYDGKGPQEKTFEESTTDTCRGCDALLFSKDQPVIVYGCKEEGCTIWVCDDCAGAMNKGSEEREEVVEDEQDKGLSLFERLAEAVWRATGVEEDS
ncbi:hypothetical protein BJ508DRAFT_9861 [Ascobolus immersus RN42]|uniref:Uncharacterized protein n=1 Tax=Ascobolus immersus RN42 TaxID=1160509 RepID=A0A3N4I3D1_ASCIM|nr:hypothetical protein BJ508DRAFT_9861 [Ascobolus immersus RN42]